jgi:Fe-S-cluster containining protein
MFSCDECGECCRNLDKSPIYAELDSGNGVCKYIEGNLCSIYEDRPLLCRIDESYEAYFKGVMSQEEYYRLNYEWCIKLKNKVKE